VWDEKEILRSSGGCETFRLEAFVVDTVDVWVGVGDADLEEGSSETVEGSSQSKVKV
jgi:hypothetical protein